MRIKVRATIDYEIDTVNYINKDIAMILVEEEEEIIESQLFQSFLLNSDTKIKVVEVKE